MNLTVRLPSGSLLAELVVNPKMLVSELKLRIARVAGLPPGRVVRWLASDHELKDQDVVDSEELVAICQDVLVGDFETYEPGCPTCDYNSKLQSARFFEDGTAWINCRIHEEARKFRYNLGTWEGEKRHFELREVLPEGEDDVPYTGVLEVTENPIYRRVHVPELDLDVEDIRYLKEVGRTALEQKLAVLFRYHGPPYVRDELRFLQQINPSKISYNEQEHWEALNRAWSSWQWEQEPQQQRSQEEDLLSIAELYDLTQATKQSKISKTSRKLYRKVKVCKGKLLRWERPHM